MLTKSDSRILELLAQAKELAREYYKLTGKPLGITGEVAEYEAATLLPHIELAEARQPGFDAVDRVTGRKYQIKGRCMQKRPKPGQRLGSIRQDHDWDAVLMVLLDEEFNATAIYEADRASVLVELNRPGSKSRNERGAMSVSKFKAIGQRVWVNAQEGHEDKA